MDKRRGRPTPDAVIQKPLAFNLEEALQVESAFRPNLLAVQNDLKFGEVTVTLRDGAVNILRFLRVWFDLPHSTFFYSVSYLDMFLAKMRVQEKFLRCLTLSCLQLAIEKDHLKVDVNQLVKISQSKCSSGDVIRMKNIVKEKVRVFDDEKPVTAADFLKIYVEILKCMKIEQWELIIKDLDEIWEKMLVRLEVLLADSSTAYLRPSALALIVFQKEVEKIMAQYLPNKTVLCLNEVVQFLSIIKEIQLKCKIRPAELKVCYMQVSKVMKVYDSQKKNSAHQRLSWNFSLSTIQTCTKLFSYHPFFKPIKE